MFGKFCEGLRDRVLKSAEATSRKAAQTDRSVADGLRIAARDLGRADRTFRPSPFEQAMQTMGSKKPEVLGGGMSMTYLAATPPGSRSVYKPDFSRTCHCARETQGYGASDTASRSEPGIWPPVR
jgi:hypothetical protein